MGIDVYMGWSGQTERDLDNGYLRESYGPEHYATCVLVPEGFDENEPEGVPIPAATLRERLPAAIEEAEKRYPDDPEWAESHSRSLRAFVELAEHKEAETGEPVRVRVSW